MQRHLGALCAVTAPSPISYLRLGPHHWSCGYDIVGVQNREAAIRICPSPAADPAERGEAFNIEFRFTDATASPYLAIGAIVRAGLQGIRDELPRPALVEGEPDDLSEDERRELGIDRLPTSLEEALDAFEADESVKNWFSPRWWRPIPRSNGTNCASTRKRGRNTCANDTCRSTDGTNWPYRSSPCGLTAPTESGGATRPGLGRRYPCSAAR